MSVTVRVARRREWDQKTRRERWVDTVELMYPPTANRCLKAVKHEALRRAQRIWRRRRSPQMTLFTFPWQQIGEDIIEITFRHDEVEYLLRQQSRRERGPHSL